MAASKASINPMDEKEVVFIPKVAGEEPTIWVGLNGKAWNIPRGQKVEVPKPVADILYESERAKTAADKYIADEQKRMRDTLANPVF